MITLITGAPGSGKSAALVDLLLGISRDRAIHANGIPDLKIPHVELVEPEKWMTEVPDGAAVVIDEVQRIWRPRGPGRAVPDHVAALETHRHRGLDFFLVTQSPRLVDTNVRALVGRHVHLRDLGILGRYWYEWPECYENCRQGWRSAPIKRRYKLPKRVFDQYKSASMHIKPIRSFPKMLVVLVGALVLTAGMTWTAYKRLTGRAEPQQMAPELSVQPASLGQLSTAAPAVAEPDFIDERVAFIPRLSGRPWTAPAYDDLRKVDKLPIITGGICMTGECKCYSGSQYLADVSSDECGDWLQQPPYQPYKVITGERHHGDQPSGQTQQQEQPYSS